MASEPGPYGKRYVRLADGTSWAFDRPSTDDSDSLEWTLRHGRGYRREPDDHRQRARELQGVAPRDAGAAKRSRARHSSGAERGHRWLTLTK